MKPSQFHASSEDQSRMKPNNHRNVLRVTVLLLVLCSLAPRPAWGELLVYEGFDYPPGVSINGLGDHGFNWGTNRWSREYAVSDWTVFSGGLQFATIPVTGGGIKETNLTRGADYQRLFKPYHLADGQALWFSFLIRVTQGASWSVHIATDQNASKIGVEGSYVDYRLRARIGVGDNGSTNTFDLGQNQVRLIVGRYVYHAGANEELVVWLDPSTAAEPAHGGSSTTNHIVYRKELTTDPDIRDRLLISNRSIGALELDEIRIGMAWSDVVSRAIDTPAIRSLVLDLTTIHLGVERLTIGATNYVESATTFAGQPAWEVLTEFVSLASTTNLHLPASATTNGSRFIRLRSQ